MEASKVEIGGVFYNVQEGYEAPYAVSPEYQLLDDNGWEELNNATLESWQKAGADYAMYEPDLSKKKLNPAGQWNNSRICIHRESSILSQWRVTFRICAFF